MGFMSLPGFTVPCLVHRTHDLCTFSWPQALTLALAFLGAVHTCCGIPSVAFTTLIVPSCPSHRFLPALRQVYPAPPHPTLSAPTEPQGGQALGGVCAVGSVQMTLSSRLPENGGFSLSAAMVPSSPELKMSSACCCLSWALSKAFSNIRSSVVPNCYLHPSLLLVILCASDQTDHSMSLSLCYP